MKIGSSNQPIKVGPEVKQAEVGEKSQASQPVSKPEASSQVELSSTASTLRSGSSPTSGDFDAEKVARIAAAIQGGTFKPNPEAIADKLVANAQEVLGKTR